MSAYEIGNKLEILHWKLNALETMETPINIEDRINLEAFVADADSWLEQI